MTRKEVVVGAVGYDALKAKIDERAGDCATAQLLDGYGPAGLSLGPRNPL